MIDRHARNRLAERLRHLATGLVSSCDFENTAMRTKDNAVFEIETKLAWPCYDDFSEQRLRGQHALSDGVRRDFARAVLFLKTGLEYEWQHRRGMRGFLDSAFRLLPPLRTPPIKTEGGDVRYWPFYRRADYFAARQAPVYLNDGKVQREPTACGSEKSPP